MKLCARFSPEYPNAEVLWDRMLDRLPSAFLERVAEIRDNRTHGAMALARWAAAAIEELPARADLHLAADLLRHAQPSMAPLARLAQQLLQSADPARTGRDFMAALDNSNSLIA